MIAIEKENTSLKGVLPKDYARLALDKQRLGELVDLIGTPLPKSLGWTKRQSMACGSQSCCMISGDWQFRQRYSGKPAQLSEIEYLMVKTHL